MLLRIDRIGALRIDSTGGYKAILTEWVRSNLWDGVEGYWLHGFEVEEKLEGFEVLDLNVACLDGFEAGRTRWFRTTKTSSIRTRSYEFEVVDSNMLRRWIRTPWIRIVALLWIRTSHLP